MSAARVLLHVLGIALLVQAKARSGNNAHRRVIHNPRRQLLAVARHHTRRACHHVCREPFCRYDIRWPFYRKTGANSVFFWPEIADKYWCGSISEGGIVIGLRFSPVHCGVQSRGLRKRVLIFHHIGDFFRSTHELEIHRAERLFSPQGFLSRPQP